MKVSPAHLHAALGWGLALLSASPCEASHNHHRLHQLHHQFEKKHHTHPQVRHSPEEAAVLEKRGTCSFPGDADPNLVAVTPDEKNGGWAMSPDQACTKDSYCPYACKPGMVMAQWEEGSTFTYPSSMNGGLYCNKNGEIEKPFPSKPYCVKGTGTVKAVNKCGKKQSLCQTVLPGNEAMLIPTLVEGTATLAVPDPSYWESTAAHYYVNPPGVGEEGCIWGDSSKEIGNWSPFVVGANTDSSGKTYVKLGHNPIFEESSLKISSVGFGVKIECPDGGCNGLPCQIDPRDGAGIVDTLLGGTGAGGSNFCVVTVNSGSTANIVTYSTDGSGGDDSSSSDKEPVEEKKEKTTTSKPPPPPPTTSEEPVEEPTTSTSELPTSTPEPEPTIEPTTSSSIKKTTPKSRPTVMPGIFHEHKNDTSTISPTHSTTMPEESTSTEDDDPVETDDDDDDDNGGALQRPNSPAAVGLLVAFVASICFF